MINLYFQCEQCMHQLPENVSPEEYSELQVGLSTHSEELIVWCKRHDRLVVALRLDDEQKARFEPKVCEICQSKTAPHEH